MSRWGLLTAVFLLACGQDLAAPGDPGDDVADDNTPDPDGTGAADGVGGGGALGVDPGRPGFTRYAVETLRSPITPSVADRMRTIAARDRGRDETVFMKVGASGTVFQSFLYCFAGESQPQYRLDLAGRDDLLATIEHFRGGDAHGSTPFDRPTLAAVVGKTASWVLSGSPSPLARETALLNPRFAFVNYGTNDMEMGATYASALPGFFENLSRVLDRLEGGGIVPIVTGLNPRGDSADAARWVPTYDAVTRGLAEARQLPYISLYRAAAPLPNQGLGADHLHGNSFSEAGSSQPCVFTPAGMGFNYNIRNLLSLEALDAARRIVVDAEPASERATLPPVAGDGSAAHPFVIDHLPFTHAFDSRRGAALVNRWACGTQNESGPEVRYRLSLPASTPVRAIVLDRADTDVDVHLVDAGDACVERGDVIAEKRLAAGEHQVVVDSFVSSAGKSWAGSYLLVVVACEAGDSRCE